MDLAKIINQEKATLVDVREPFEYATGYAEGAVNIPLGNLPNHLETLKKEGHPIVVYCRSGMRSAQAMGFLRAQGINHVYNGGSLDEVLHYQKQLA